MKNLYTLCVLILLNHFSFSQTYHPLIRQNVYWDVMYYDYGVNPTCGYVWGGRFYFDGNDTLINNIQYKVLRGHPVASATQNPFCGPFSVDTSILGTKRFMREDTVNRRVYVYDQSNNIDDLLYDFSLNQGDTLQSYYAGYGSILVVDSIGTISLLNGEIRNVFYLNSGERYIEEIGGSQGLIFPLVMGIGFGFSAGCVIENGNTVYDWGFLGSCLPIVGIDETLNKNRINIFPNPVSNNINLNYPSNKEDGTLRIFDVLGNLVIEEIILAFTENKNVDISRINPGIYLCRVVWANKILAAKIIKE